MLKQQFIESFRKTPGGITEFMGTPIPEPPSVSIPADVDAAIIAQGVLAAYLLQVFDAFAGLTPVELLLRIGQHNSVLESAMLAGLELLQGTGAADDFEILFPQDGGVYLPGSFNIRAKAKSEAVITSMAGSFSGADFVLQRDESGQWRALFELSEEGDYTLNITAVFADSDPVTKSAAFVVSRDPVPAPAPDPDPDDPDPDPDPDPDDPDPIPPEPPEDDDDDDGIDRILDRMLSALKGLMGLSRMPLDTLLSTAGPAFDALTDGAGKLAAIAAKRLPASLASRANSLAAGIASAASSASGALAALSDDLPEGQTPWQYLVESEPKLAILGASLNMIAGMLKL